MKQKKELLRLRPFNMANFSSGAGHLMMLGMIMSWMIILPLMFLVWAGFALPMKSEDGILNYQVLVRRLNRILLPICIVLFGLLFWSISGTISEAGVLLPLWVASFPTLGIFLAARQSAAWLHASKRRSLTKGKWFLFLLVAVVSLILIGALGTFLFAASGPILF